MASNASAAPPVIRRSVFCLSHVPELVRYGSKPRREIARDAAGADRLEGALRDDAAAVAYPPNQVFIGAREPRSLSELPRPWHTVTDAGAERSAAAGEILDQQTFYALLARADVLEPPLFTLTRSGAERLAASMAAHPMLSRRHAGAFDDRVNEGSSEEALPIFSGGVQIGEFRRDVRANAIGDDSLAAHVLLENLCSKASGALALECLLDREGIDASEIDFILSCGEEAAGDRYQRGGGGMAKAIGELCGCVSASGMDVKNFCAAPGSALLTAAALVQTGLFRRVAVVGGGSLAKLGMKLEGFLEHGVPILEDCLASLAVLVCADDGESPALRLEPGAVGIAPIGASASDEAVYRKLLLGPLETLGLAVTDVDRFAPELHNPEIMQFAGSGDVAHKNYRSIAAMAVLAGQLERGEMEAFVERVGMPGFAPTQGHIPSGLPYLPHAARAMQRGEIERVMVLAKASLFLSRMTGLYDGISFMLEANPASRRTGHE